MYTTKHIPFSFGVNALLLVLIAAVCPSLVKAQTRYKPVRKTTDTSVDKKVVIRDLTLYPLTEAGTANFNAAISACSLQIIARPVAGAVVGTYSYAFSDNRRDINNQLFVSEVAPVLISRERNAPRLIGNHYTFTPQSALNTALLARIEPFQVHPSKLIVYPGVNFEDPTDRSTILTRGFNAVAESVPKRTMLSGNRGVYLGPFYGLANELAEQLGQNDPSYPWLKNAGNQAPPLLIDNEVAGKAFGRHVYSSLLSNSDWSLNRSGILAFCPDFENHLANPLSTADRYDQWRNMVGYFMEGTKEAALAEGKTPPMFIPYDHGNVTPASLSAYEQGQPQSGVFYDEQGRSYNIYQPEVGVPVYMHPNLLEPALRGTTRSAPLNANGPLGQYIKNNPSAMGSQEYIHYTGDDETYFEKNSAGRFVIDEQSGHKTLQWRTQGRQIVAFGQAADIVGAKEFYNGEYFDLVYETYERIAQAVTAQYFRAGGKHLPLSTDRQPGWENLKLQQWFRFDREFKDEARLPSTNPTTDQPYSVSLLNTQQLYAPMLARDVMVQYMFRDVLRFWMASQGTVTTQGKNTVDKYDDHSDVVRAPQSIGSMEVVSNALYRASRFDYLHDANTPWRLICPRYWIKNNSRGKSWYDRLESFEKKPLLLGGIVPNHNGKTKLWMLWSYPAQDVEMKTEVLMWVDKNDGAGPITPAYRLLLSGRSTGLDDWEVPQSVANAEPKHIKFQFTDMTGEKQTWTGDYRVPVIYGDGGPMPPPVAAITGPIHE